MTLQEAWKVAKTIAECLDPPVIRGMYESLDKEFPEFKFEFGTGWDENDMEWGRVRVTAHHNGVIPVVIEGNYDDPV